MWNSLNNTIRNVDTLSKFKSELMKIDKTENHAIHYLGTEHLIFRGGGGYGFLFRTEIFFLTTRELEYLFFCHQNRNIFFSNIGNQNIFLEKKHTPPPLQVKWSFPYMVLGNIILFKPS